MSAFILLIVHRIFNSATAADFRTVEIATDTSLHSSTLVSPKFTFVIDTGSPILPKSEFLTFFSLKDLKRCNDKIFDYSGGRMRILGELDMKLSWRDREAIETVIVTQDGKPLLGLRAFEKLHVLTLWEVNNVTKVQTRPKYNHKVAIRKDILQVKQKMRRIPLALREKVQTELDEMEKRDIIEKVDESQSVSNLVVVPKRN